MKKRTKVAGIVLAGLIVIGIASGNEETGTASTTSKASVPSIPVTETAEISNDTTSEIKREEAYLREVRDTTESLGGHMMDFSDAMYTFNPYDQESQIDLAIALGNAQMDIEEWRESDVDVPDRYQEVDRLFNEAMDQYYYVMTELPSAIDSMDADRINELTYKLEQANNKIGRVTEETNKSKRF